MLRNLASAHRGAGDDDAELSALERALDVDRRDLIAWMRKAELHQRRGENGDAFQAWNSALALAQPLRPWSGPMAESLEQGQSFVLQGAQTMRAVIDERLGPLAGQTRRRGDAPVERRLSIPHWASAASTSTNATGSATRSCRPTNSFDDQHFPLVRGPVRRDRRDPRRTDELIKDPGEALRPYVRMEPGIGENKWSGLDNSLDWGAIFLWEYGEANRPVLERCPETARLLESLPVSHIPGGRPARSFDAEAAHAHSAAYRRHQHSGDHPFAAGRPDGCGFRVGGEIRPWVVGKPFAFDDTIEHEAWNDSDESSVPS